MTDTQPPCVSKPGLARKEKLYENNLIVPRGHILNIHSALRNRDFHICSRPTRICGDGAHCYSILCKGLGHLQRSWNQSAHGCGEPTELSLAAAEVMGEEPVFPRMPLFISQVAECF